MPSPNLDNGGLVSCFENFEAEVGTIIPLSFIAGLGRAIVEAVEGIPFFIEVYSLLV